MDHTPTKRDSIQTTEPKRYDTMKHYKGKGEVAFVLLSGSSFQPFRATSRDEPIAVELAKHGTDVYAIDMCTTPWPEDVSHLPSCVLEAQQLYNILCKEYSRIGILGISSGGFFAAIVARMVKARHLLLIAPILDPAQRPRSEERKWANQMAYFKTEKRIAQIRELHVEGSFPVDSMLLMGGNDSSAPREVARPPWCNITISSIHPDADHFFMVTGKCFMSRICSFLDY